MKLLISVWLFVTLVCDCAYSSSLTIQDAGLREWNIDDTALVIYLTIFNKGREEVTDVLVDTHNCCLDPEDFGPGDHCQILNALSDSAPIIKAKAVMNFTLLLPTIYPYDRNGDCTVEIQYNKVYHIQHKVHFDTRLSKENRPNLPASVREMTAGLSPCSSPDQDPVRGCNPVICSLKYGINRGYYNLRTQRCENPPKCSSTPQHPMIFSEDTSSCRDEELRMVEKRPPVGLDISKTRIFKDFSLLKKYNLVCVHGKRTASGCDCDWGWTTSTDGHSAFDPEEKVYKLCNQQTKNYIHSLKPTSLIAAMLATSFLALVLLVTLVTITKFHRKTEAKRLSQMSLTTLRDTLTAKEQQEGMSKEVFAIARAIVPHEPILEGELRLRVNDLITNMERTNTAGIWIGTSNGESGKFPVASVEFFLPTDTLPGEK